MQTHRSPMPAAQLLRLILIAMLLGSLTPGAARAQSTPPVTIDPPQLVMDINSQYHLSFSTSGARSSRSYRTWIGDTYFFAADDAIHGQELWKSDGTVGGTVMVKNLNPSGSSSPTELVSVGGKLFFFAYSYDFGRELWVSDGSSDGTQMVVNIFPDAGKSEEYYDINNLLPDKLVGCGSRVFFAADGSLWSSDGTAANTGPVSLPGEYVAQLEGWVCYEGAFYFIAWEDDQISILRADATTTQVSVFWTREQGVTTGSFAELWATELGLQVAIADDLLVQLWQVSGHSGDPVLLAEFPREWILFIIYPQCAGQSLYFLVLTQSFNSSIWVTDGTPDGTKLVLDPEPYDLIGLYAVGDHAFAYITDANGNGQLWSIDSASESTRVVYEGALYFFENGLIDYQGRLYFSSDRVNHFDHAVLLSSDGTPEGTGPVLEITDLGDLLDFSVHGGKLYFHVGRDLWVSEGTAETTRAVGLDMDGLTQSSSPLELTQVDGRVFFRASESSTSTSVLMVVEGDPWSVRQLTAFDGQKGGWYPHRLVDFNGKLFFNAMSLEAGTEPWISDGTPEGTHLLKDINPGSASSVGAYGMDWIVYKDRVYFTANDGQTGEELWVTDGTPEGTVRFADLAPGKASSSPAYFYVANDWLLFTIDEDIDASPYRKGALWATDGVETMRLTTRTNVSSKSSSSTEIGTAENYFFTKRSGEYVELWKSDGTPEGTLQVRSFGPFPAGSYCMKFLGGVGSTFFFTADDGAHGCELWKTDGTAEGTVLVRDINEGVAQTYFLNPAVMNGVLYFSADTPSSGRELWRSDGSEAGTYMVIDLRPGETSTSMVSLRVVNGRLYWTSAISSSQTAMFTSDGTAVGTHQVPGLASGSWMMWGTTDFVAEFTANPTDPHRILFVGDNGILGRELWALNINHAPSAERILHTAVADRTNIIPTAGSDFDGDRLASQVKTSPQNGVMEGGDSLVLTLDRDYAGYDTFTYTVSDSFTESEEASGVLLLLEPGQEGLLRDAAPSEPVALAFPDRARLDAPAGAWAEAVTLGFVNTPSIAADPAACRSMAGSFSVDVLVGDVPREGYAFAQPVQVSVKAAQPAEKLVLYRAEEPGQWARVGLAQPGAEEGWVTLAVEQSGAYALWAESACVYLPLIRHIITP